MSDLYLVLRSRLEAVADWIVLGTETLHQARTQAGLSYEAIARQIPVSSKTWERWEKRGAVPRPYVVKVAELLGLQIEEADRVRLSLPPDLTRDDEIAAIREELAEVRGMVAELLRLEREIGRAHV